MRDYPDDGDALRRVAADGSDMSRPMEVDFMVAVGDATSADAIAAAAQRLGYRTEVVDDSGDGKTTWTVYCTRTMILTYDAVVLAQQELDRLGRAHGGRSDGWGTFGNAPK